MVKMMIEFPSSICEADESEDTTGQCTLRSYELYIWQPSYLRALVDVEREEKIEASKGRRQEQKADGGCCCVLVWWGSHSEQRREGRKELGGTRPEEKRT